MRHFFNYTTNFATVLSMCGVIENAAMNERDRNKVVQIPSLSTTTREIAKDNAMMNLIERDITWYDGN